MAIAQIQLPACNRRVFKRKQRAIQVQLRTVHMPKVRVNGIDVGASRFVLFYKARCGVAAVNAPA